MDILAHQSRPLDHLIVVDNGNDPTVKTLLENAGATANNGTGMAVTYVPSQHNLGGAGGFALGMLHALALGADWVWCADDDGHPDGPDVLRTLLDCAERYQLDQVSPVVCTIDDPTPSPSRCAAAWPGGANAMNSSTTMTPSTRTCCYPASPP